MSKQLKHLEIILPVILLLTFNAAWAGSIKTKPATKIKKAFTANAKRRLVSPTCVSLGSAPTTTQNYVLVNTPRVPVTDPTTIGSKTNCQVQQTIQYFDGLGRPVQTVQVKASPQNKDIIVPQSYDNYGREVKKYTPYADETGTANGAFRSTMYAGQASFYSSTSSPPPGVVRTAFPFSQSNIEFSPLNRPLEQGAQGADWQPGKNHTVRMAYGNNDAASMTTGDGRWALYYTATVNADSSRSLVNNGAYPDSSLYVTVMKDENWTSGKTGTVEQYTDRKGHMVVKRVWYSETVAYSTYYVYDDFDNLCFVLTPGASPDAGLSTPASQSTLNNLCYQYRYDQRGRMIQKKLPGKGWEYIVYNVIDQPVATQDSLQRAAKQWIYTKYDAQGRAIINGIWVNGATPTAISRAALQTLVNAITTNLWEAPVNSGTGYNNAAWPTTYTTPLTINYYDTYANIPSIPTGTYTAPAGASTQTLGLLTATKTAVLNTPANMLWSVVYYDDLGRNIKTYKQHYLGGTLNTANYDAITTTYDFTNAPTTTTRQHYIRTATTPLVTIANTIIYDQLGRKLKNWELITNGTTLTTKTLLSQINYNEIGQVMNKQLHSTDSTTFLQTVNYAYNERGWLLNDSSAFFKMRLQYNTGTNKIYNGNIAYQTWTTQGSSAKTFTYLYDPLNRFTSGKSSDNNAERGIGYDIMGNITMLSRQVNNTLVDSLVYTYTSGTNKLANIIDKTASNTGLVSGTTNYTFDGNGNLAANSNTTNTGQNKSFTYNLLNLPQVVTVPSGTITYTYDASGRKLRKVSVISGTTTTTEYIDGIQYKNSTTAIDFIQTEEGRAITSGSACDYYYNLIDHLGNTRVTFHTSGGAAIVQQADYLPFGVAINETSPGPNPKNEYLYNGKELQDELTQYDYGARLYDPLIGRWGVIDPLAEKSRRWSPYNYAMDNPVRFIDVDGMSSGQFHNPDFPTVADAFANLDEAEIKDGISTVNVNINSTTDENGGTKNTGSTSTSTQPAAVNETDKKTEASGKNSTKTNKKDASHEEGNTTRAIMASTLILSTETSELPPLAGAVLVAGAAYAYYIAESQNDFYYVTYTKTSIDGKVYVGRSSGYGNPYSIVNAREANHHVIGYGPAILSTYARSLIPGAGYAGRAFDPAYYFIRGSEQLQIEFYRNLGISGNIINGISPNNPNIQKYLDAGSEQ